MNLRTRQREAPDINLTPLIDVVFLLLIFFMVSTTFKREAQLKVDLPEAAAAPVQAQEKTIEIVINAEGRYFINGKEVVNTRQKTLILAMKKTSGGNNKLPLIIRADAKTPHQAVVTAMDAARQLGFVNLSIATAQTKN